MLISLRTLERHLDWIGRRYTLVSLDDMDAGSSSPRRGGKPLAAVTFDDGYRDTYSLALPLLERKGIPGAVFVVTDLIGTTRLQRHDALFLLLSRGVAHWRHPASTIADALRRHGATPASAQRVALLKGHIMKLGDAGDGRRPHGQIPITSLREWKREAALSIERNGEPPAFPRLELGRVDADLSMQRLTR